MAHLAVEARIAPLADRALPPQSTSDSVPSCLWSLHWLLAHTNVSASHALLEQSLFAWQAFPMAQNPHTPPPQSMSVSAPSL